VISVADWADLVAVGVMMFSAVAVLAVGCELSRRDVGGEAGPL
jgi:hypothetical protein